MQPFTYLPVMTSVKLNKEVFMRKNSTKEIRMTINSIINISFIFTFKNISLSFLAKLIFPYQIYWLIIMDNDDNSSKTVIRVLRYFSILILSLYKYNHPLPFFPHFLSLTSQNWNIFSLVFFSLSLSLPSSLSIHSSVITPIHKEQNHTIFTWKEESLRLISQPFGNVCLFHGRTLMSFASLSLLELVAFSLAMTLVNKLITYANDSFGF